MAQIGLMHGSDWTGATVRLDPVVHLRLELVNLRIEAAKRERCSQMTDPSNSDAELNGNAVLQTLGNGRVVKADGEAGTCTLEFTVAPEMCHSGGVAQGGFVTGWIDAAMAHACIARYTTDFWIATLEVKVSFFRPVGPGLVTAEGWIERAGKQTVFAEGRLLDAEGKIAAKASSTIRLVPNRV